MIRRELVPLNNWLRSGFPIDPSTIDRGFRISVHVHSGECWAGVVRSVSPDSVDLSLLGGPTRTIPRSEIRAVHTLGPRKWADELRVRASQRSGQPAMVHT